MSSCSSSHSGGSTTSTPSPAEDATPNHPKGRYERGGLLGTGAFKTVFHAYDKEEGLEVAWNQVRLAGIPASQRKKIRSEIKILEQLSHPNIINIFDYWEFEDKYVVFITELMTSGTLKDYLRQAKTIRLRIVKKMCRQILSGLEYLHSHDPPIIHRDIKCDNIFTNSSRGEVKIGDLGLSIMMKDKKFAVSVIGTPEFMAPELYDEKYDEKIDIYSFGMCLLEMVTGRYPYSECENAAQVYRKVTQGVKPLALDSVPDHDLKKFISSCLDHQPSLRPSAKELRAHLFLQDRNEDNDKVFFVYDDEDNENNQDSDGADEQPVRSQILSRVEIPSFIGHCGAISAASITPPDQHRVFSQDETTMFPSLKIAPNSESPNLQTYNDSLIRGVDGGEIAVQGPASTSTAVADTIQDEEGWVTQVVFLDEESDCHKIQMKLYLRIDGVFKEIRFPFMVRTDTPGKVADEMVKEIGLNPSSSIHVANMISNALTDASHSGVVDSASLSKLVPPAAISFPQTQLNRQPTVTTSVVPSISPLSALATIVDRSTSIPKLDQPPVFISSPQLSGENSPTQNFPATAIAHQQTRKIPPSSALGSSVCPGSVGLTGIDQCLAGSSINRLPVSRSLSQLKQVSSQSPDGIKPALNPELVSTSRNKGLQQRLSLDKYGITADSTQDSHQLQTTPKTIQSPDCLSMEEYWEEGDLLTTFPEDSIDEGIKRAWIQVVERQVREIQELRERHRNERLEFAKVRRSSLPSLQAQSQTDLGSMSSVGRIPRSCSHAQLSSTSNATAQHPSSTRGNSSSQTSSGPSKITGLSPAQPALTHSPQMMSLLSVMESKIVNELFQSTSNATAPANPAAPRRSLRSLVLPLPSEDNSSSPESRVVP